MNKSRHGVASLYVVIFTTIILSIVTMSFVRIILSESVQSTNKELSNSAYDSAMAGIEDAKIVLLKYQDCISRGFTSLDPETNSDADTCSKVIFYAEKLMENQSCDVTAEILKRGVEATGEIRIKHLTSGKPAKPDEKKDKNAIILNQAYSCVKVSRDNDEYLSYLDSKNRSRVVPLRVEDLNGATKIRFKWHSARHYDNSSSDDIKGKLKFYNGSFEQASERDPYRPPVIKLQLLQADRQFHLGDFNLDNYAGSNHTTNRGTLILAPKKSSEGMFQTKITADYFSSTNDKNLNQVTEVQCNERQDYICSLEVAFPRPFLGGERNSGAALLKVSLPYGDMGTDFGVQVCDDKNNCKKFLNVQAAVDSTGRAVDFYRRVESRIEMIDTNFPFPENTITTKEDLKKNFYITRNCWTEDGVCSNYGEL